MQEMPRLAQLYYLAHAFIVSIVCGFSGFCRFSYFSMKTVKGTHRNVFDVKVKGEICGQCLS